MKRMARGVHTGVFVTPMRVLAWNSCLLMVIGGVWDFKHGSRYAWKVTAFLNGVKMTESEVNEFRYGDAPSKVRGKVVDATNKDKDRSLLEDTDFNLGSFDGKGFEGGPLMASIRERRDNSLSLQLKKRNLFLCFPGMRRFMERIRTGRGRGRRFRRGSQRLN